MKTAILILTIFYFLIAFLLPTYRLRKNTGLNPFTFSGEDNAHNFIGKIFKIVMALLFINVIVYSVFHSWYEYLGPIGQLEQWVYLKYIGIFLVLISLYTIFVAQRQMANSWRIGIDYKNQTSLVTSGVFKLSRNPIFLGIQVGLLGIFFATPNLLMLFIFLIGAICIQIQVRLEEEFLMRQNQDEYRKYKKAVRRWI